MWRRGREAAGGRGGEGDGARSALYRGDSDNKALLALDIFRAAAKNRYTLSVWGLKQVHSKIN